MLIVARRPLAATTSNPAMKGDRERGGEEEEKEGEKNRRNEKRGERKGSGGLDERRRTVPLTVALISEKRPDCPSDLLIYSPLTRDRETCRRDSRGF